MLVFKVKENPRVFKRGGYTLLNKSIFKNYLQFRKLSYIIQHLISGLKTDSSIMPESCKAVSLFVQIKIFLKRGKLYI